MKLLFGCFLVIASIQDYCWKQVEWRVYLLFGGAAWMCQIMGECSFLDFISSMIPGICLLILSFLSRGAIGIGDGLFFLVSGWLLSIQENLLLLFGGLLLCGGYSLGYLVVSQFTGHYGNRKTVIPFLPFLMPVGIWIMVTT